MVEMILLVYWLHSRLNVMMALMAKVTKLIVDEKIMGVQSVAKLFQLMPAV